MAAKPEKRIEGIKLIEKIYDLNKLAEDIKLIKESVAKQEPGAKGFTESQGALRPKKQKLSYALISENS